MKTRQAIVALCFDKRGRVISVGRNNYSKSHPIQASFAKKAKEPCKIYLHAEIDALIKSGRTNVYGLRVIRRGKKDGELLPSKPCAVCLEAIKAFGVKQLQFT